MQPVLDRLRRRRPAVVIGYPSDPGAQILQSIADRIHAPLRMDTSFGLLALDELAREFQGFEVVVVLQAEGIRAAIARSLSLKQECPFSPEPGQAVAFDWPHPEARDFKHALISMGLDWDVGLAANKVHSFPGGASVLPRSG